MKTLLTPIACLFLTAAHSQIEIVLSGQSTDISGTVQSREINDAVNDSLMLYFDVLNTSGNTMDLVITRKIVSQPLGWSNYFCWGISSGGGACYPASSNLLYVSGTYAIADTGHLSTYISAPAGGSAHYRYYVSEEGGSYLDSVDMTVNSLAAVESNEISALTIYPNPSNSFVVIENDTPFSYTLIHPDGRILFDSMEQKKSALVNLADLPSGIYYLHLTSGKASAIRSIQKM